MNAPNDLRRQGRNVVIFIALAISISWTIALFAWRAGVFDQMQTFIVGAFAFMWGPAIAAIICAFAFHKGERSSVLGLRPRFNNYLLYAWFLPLVIVLASVVITVFLSDRSLVSLATGMMSELKGSGLESEQALPPHIDFLMPIGAATFAAATNSLLLISEELGWRGYLYSQLKPWGFWKTALVTGSIWGVWHAPLIVLGYNYPGMPMMGVFFMIMVSTLISVPITFLRMKNGSVWAACVFHGTLNAVAPLSLFAISDASMPWRGVMGLGGILALLVCATIIWWLLRNADEGTDLN